VLALFLSPWRCLAQRSARRGTPGAALRQREGIALAKAAGKYKGRKAALTGEQADELRARLARGESVSGLAREYGISRQSVYNYKTA
jgi:DNA invertase Pin-like site-specific DNA recombinase